MKALLIATTNRGKVDEFMQALSPAGIPCMDLSRFPEVSACPETGKTFRANAVQKARHYHRISGLMTLAEDSGLEIDALNGRPGIYSARFAGEGARDGDNIRQVLRLMKGVPENERRARFVCVIAVVSDGQLIKTIRRTCRGSILFKPDGTGGFGYDPIFYYPPAQKSFARMTRTEKNGVSHRGKALRALPAIIKNL